MAAASAERVGTRAEVEPVHAVEVGVDQELHVEGHVRAVHREGHAGADGMDSGAGGVGGTSARHGDLDLSRLEELA